MNHEAVYRTAPATPGLLKTAPDGIDRAGQGRVILKISAQTCLNWFLLSLQTAKPSTTTKYFCFHHQDFCTKYFFFLWYDDVYHAKGHMAVDLRVQHRWEKNYLKILMRKTCLGFFNIEESCNFDCLWGIFLDIMPACCTSSSYDLHKYFRFSFKFVNIMKKLCKWAMTLELKKYITS